MAKKSKAYRDGILQAWLCLHEPRTLNVPALGEHMSRYLHDTIYETFLNKEYPSGSVELHEPCLEHLISLFDNLATDEVDDVTAAPPRKAKKRKARQLAVEQQDAARQPLQQNVGQQQHQYPTAAQQRPQQYQWPQQQQYQLHNAAWQDPPYTQQGQQGQQQYQQAEETPPWNPQHEANVWDLNLPSEEELRRFNLQLQQPLQPHQPLQLPHPLQLPQPMQLQQLPQPMQLQQLPQPQQPMQLQHTSASQQLPSSPSWDLDDILPSGSMDLDDILHGFS